MNGIIKKNSWSPLATALSLPGQMSSLPPPPPPLPPAPFPNPHLQSAVSGGKAGVGYGDAADESLLCGAAFLMAGTNEGSLGIIKKQHFTM